MVRRYVVMGKRGSFITAKKNAKVHWKVGDFTNITGTIKSTTLIKKRKKKRR